MRTIKESGFDGPLPWSIKPDGFHCYRRGGCDQGAICESEGECLGAEPPPADTLSRNRFDEIAAIILTLTYAEMIEFAGGLWSLRGGAGLNSKTLPKILHAWATGMAASDFAAHNEPAVPAGELDCSAGTKIQPIETAPKDRPILAFMVGRWRIARWKSNHPPKRPIPFWSAEDLRVVVSRAHQPQWWAEFPPSPPEADA